MAEHIPFVTGDDACALVNKTYGDSELVRVPLDRADGLISRLSGGKRIWLDPAVDGLHDLSTRSSAPDRPNYWFEYIKTTPGFDKIADPSFHLKPDAGTVYTFVKSVLDRCASHRPAWITVPQLPLVSGSGRNKINRALAAAAGKWRNTGRFSGRLILPLVFTHQEQINGKTERNPKVAQAARCYEDANADGLWVVDKSLTDDNGSRTLRNTRLPALICLHQELNARIQSGTRIAGPYWGMNLVLWARGLVDFAGIGVGSGYQYYLAGGHTRQPIARLALGPLRRRAGAAQLRSWLDQTIAKLGTSHPAQAEFADLRKQLPLLSAPERAREQVATSYKRWFDTVSAAPVAGRPVALFQDLSSAYALGRMLPDMGREEKTARRPEAVAEPLMLNCL